MPVRLTRRSLLRAAAPCAALCIAAPSLAAPPVKVLRVGTGQTSDSQHGFAIRTFGEELAARTDGRYRVEMYANGELGDDATLFDALRLGSAHVGLLGVATIERSVPEFGVFSVPFLFRDAAHARRALDGPLGGELMTRFEATGMTGLAWSETGVRHLTNAIRPVRNPVDMAGLKLRLQQSDIQIMAFKALGAEPVPLALNELFGALKSGRVDGQENPLSTILSGRFYEVQKHLSLTSHLYGPSVFIMSPTHLKAMEPRDQAAAREAARIAGRATRDYISRTETEIIDRLRQFGMTVTTDVDTAAFAKALAPLEGDFAKRFGADRLAAIRSAA